MDIKLDLFEVVKSLKETGHLPKRFEAEEIEVSMPKVDEESCEEGVVCISKIPKCNVTWAVEQLCEEGSIMSFYGYLD